MFVRFLSVVVIAFFLGYGLSYAERQEVSLDGVWEFQQVSDRTYPPSDSWGTTNLPGYVEGWNNTAAWFRKEFVVPEVMTGAHMRLCFGGVKYDSKVWLNGQYVGGYLNGYEPFELDVNAALLVGETNELLVGVGDWTSVFSSPVDFSGLQDGEQPRYFATNVVLSPIGGRYEIYGIWQPVTLRSTPYVSVEEVFIQPSTRTEELTVSFVVRNDGTVELSSTISNRVFDGESVMVELPATMVTLAAGQMTNVEVAVSWTNAHLWNHEDPYLYSLETRAFNSDDSVDAQTNRFGFREFWAEADRLFLNGIPVNLLATSCWPPRYRMDEADMRQVIQDVKAGNNVAIRFHTQPWDTRWYDIADEEGLLVVDEGAVWCGANQYRLSDQTFWTNYQTHLEGMVKRGWNHPSIIMWSLENELLHVGGYEAYTGTIYELKRMGDVVRTLDPTRLITYESDLDPDDMSDVENLHYPHEFPEFHLWPNTAYWMDESIVREWLDGGTWSWDHTKPLYIGEFLWVASGAAEDHTILFGDEAYKDRAAYRNQTKAMTFRMQIEAYRAYGVNGICPWTMFEDASVPWGVFALNTNDNELYQSQKAAYHPNAVFPMEYNTRFFVNENTQRNVRIFNDRLSAGNFELRWRVNDDEVWQDTSFTLEPATQRCEVLAFVAPSNSGSFELHIEMFEGVDCVFSNTLSYEAFDRELPALAEGVRVGVYDPAGSVTGNLSAVGMSYSVVTNMQTVDYGQLDVLLIGPDGLGEEEGYLQTGEGSVPSLWHDFMFNGGWVVVMEQTNYPYWMPYDLRLSDFAATISFPESRHMINGGRPMESYRWWSGNHRVVDRALLFPEDVNFRTIGEIGSSRGLEYAAALEVPVGLGGMICSQWLMGERFNEEPMARELFSRCINYCAQSNEHVALKPCGVLSDETSNIRDKLSKMGLLGEDLQGRMQDGDFSAYAMVMIAGGDAVWNEAESGLPNLVNYVTNGGTLLLHRPSSSFLTAAQAELIPGVEGSEVPVSMALVSSASNTLAWLNNHNIYWVATPGTWADAEVLTTNLAQRLYHKVFSVASSNVVKVKDMPIRTSGAEEGEGIWGLYSSGYVAQTVTVSEAGAYSFNMYARGTPVTGGWPQMTLHVDGAAQDTILVSSTQIAAYTMSAELGVGSFEVGWSFDNDAYAPPEDRNLFLDEVHWGKDVDVSCNLLTRPGCIAQIALGSGMIILDEILWETETQNQTKAERYLCRLLTDLGATLIPQQPALDVEGEDMTNVNVASYNAYGGRAHLLSNGRIEMPVDFTTTTNYVFTIRAAGSPAASVYPLMAFSVDGVTQQVFSVNSESMQDYGVTNHVAAGIHVVGISFINDYYADPEDRNLYVDRVSIRAEKPASDQWRYVFFSAADLQNELVSGLSADPDGDGADNWQEYIADTDPTDAESVLKVTGIDYAEGGVLTVGWRGGRDVQQELEMCSSLETGQWYSLYTNDVPSALVTSFSYNLGVYTSCFYRIRATR